MKEIVQSPKLQGVCDGGRHVNSKEMVDENPHMDSQDQETHSSEEKFHPGKHGAFSCSFRVSRGKPVP